MIRIIIQVIRIIYSNNVIRIMEQRDSWNYSNCLDNNTITWNNYSNHDSKIDSCDSNHDSNVFKIFVSHPHSESAVDFLRMFLTSCVCVFRTSSECICDHMRVYRNIRGVHIEHPGTVF